MSAQVITLRMDCIRTQRSPPCMHTGAKRQTSVCMRLSVAYDVCLFVVVAVAVVVVCVCVYTVECFFTTSVKHVAVAVNDLDLRRTRIGPATSMTKPSMSWCVLHRYVLLSGSTSDSPHVVLFDRGHTTRLHVLCSHFFFFLSFPSDPPRVGSNARHLCLDHARRTHQGEQKGQLSSAPWTWTYLERYIESSTCDSYKHKLGRQARWVPVLCMAHACSWQGMPP